MECCGIGANRRSDFARQWAILRCSVRCPQRIGAVRWGQRTLQRVVCFKVGHYQVVRNNPARLAEFAAVIRRIRRPGAEETAFRALGELTWSASKKVRSECSATVSVAPVRGATETVALLSRIVIARFF